MDVYNLVSFAGIFVLIAFAWVLSCDRKNMNWRVIGWGIGLVLRAGDGPKLSDKARAWWERGALVWVILAIATSGGGAGFVIAGRKVEQQEGMDSILVPYFLAASLFLLLPEITVHPIPNLSLWLGFIVGGLLAAIRKQRNLFFSFG